MSRLRALLWDVDGTLAETERDGHRVAFNLAFEEAGVSWRWDEACYGELLKVAGGRERLLAFLNTVDEAPADAPAREDLADRLHRRKNAFYADLVRRQALPLREGVRPLLDECRARGVIMAITTTTGRGNLDALLSTTLGPDWETWFAAVVCGEDVGRKKPDPEVFTRALERLELEAAAAVAIEDSPDGVAAARAAGVPVMMARSRYFEATPIEGAIAVGPALHDRRGWRPEPSGARGRREAEEHVGLDDIVAWHAGHIATQTEQDHPGFIADTEDDRRVRWS